MSKRKIAIIDADIIGKEKHRFPNLCSMKISAYHKSIGDDVVLKLDYDGLNQYDKVYISKVFTSTVIPGEDKGVKKDCNTISEFYDRNQFLKQDNIVYGGTGFFYDKAPPLPYNIEHIMPDYHLYDEWVNEAISNGKKPSEFKYYLEYSIGYLTRKCFRKCPFCVNRNYNHSEAASPLDEFMDPDRKKLCFLDDNFFSFPRYKDLIRPVVSSGKVFQFKQGLDERLLNEDKVVEMSGWKYDGDMIFAFDNVKDADLIIQKLEMIKKLAPNWKRNHIMFYVFCGFDRDGVYDDDFWHNDILDLFKRIEILGRYGAHPYIMRFEKVYKSEYSSFYSAVAAWCNQVSFFRRSTFRDFCKIRGMLRGGYSIYKTDFDAYLASVGKKGKEWKVMEEIEEKFPDISEKYYNFCGRRS